MKKIFLLCVLGIWLLSLAACGGSSAMPEETWKLVSLNGNPVIEGTGLTIGFEEDRVFGNAGCNSFGGTYELDGSGLKFDALVTTLMACAGEGLMAQESAYLAALSAVETMENGEAGLILRGPEVELVYSK